MHSFNFDETSYCAGNNCPPHASRLNQFVHPTKRLATATTRWFSIWPYEILSPHVHNQYRLAIKPIVTVTAGTHFRVNAMRRDNWKSKMTTTTTTDSSLALSLGLSARFVHTISWNAGKTTANRRSIFINIHINWAQTKLIAHLTPSAAVIDQNTNWFTMKIGWSSWAGIDTCQWHCGINQCSVLCVCLRYVRQRAALELIARIFSSASNEVALLKCQWLSDIFFLISCSDKFVSLPDCTVCRTDFFQLVRSA